MNLLIKYFFFSSILSYAPHSSQDYGEVECIAKNSIGIQQRPCRYIITESSKSCEFCCCLLIINNFSFAFRTS